MIKILFISDTHANNDWIGMKYNYDYVIHAGDHLNSHEFMIKNTDWFVDGNNDFGNQHMQVFEIENFKFLLVHGDEQNIRNYEKDWYIKLLDLAIKNNADVILFGHTHIPVIKSIESKIFINSGFFYKPKNSNKKSYCEIRLDRNNIEAKIVYIDDTNLYF